jgi:hypothetical protein
MLYIKFKIKLKNTILDTGDKMCVSVIFSIFKMKEDKHLLTEKGKEGVRSMENEK